MAKTNNIQPEIFNEIIRKRVADYMDKEMKEIMRQKMDSIIRSVLVDLQTNAKLYQDMLLYETRLVVKAIYNGKDVEQANPKKAPNV